MKYSIGLMLGLSALLAGTVQAGTTPAPTQQQQFENGISSQKQLQQKMQQNQQIQKQSLNQQMQNTQRQQQQQLQSQLQRDLQRSQQNQTTTPRQ
ncbi:DUF2756 domain-containing protein [Affinibrenneria salicis]|uniref:DUF2756 domain-containing protein n=1 Tax=Affinibrenneria salicis TaxID=2590031 RepID=UPI00168A5D66|nr:DUF2756 domain-containing protein [Affinibrenneria salicis]